MRRNLVYLALLAFCAVSAFDPKGRAKIEEEADDYGDDDVISFEEMIDDEVDTFEEMIHADVDTFEEMMERGAKCLFDVRQPGEIKSPLSRNNYPKRLNCKWKIKAPRGKRVEVEFTDFEVERHKTCKPDYVALYDGFRSSNDIRMAKLCGYEPSDPFYPDQVYVSSGRFMTIRFKTNRRIEKRGWIAKISFVGPQSVCTSNPTVLTSDTQLTYPLSGSYDNGQNCRWLIQAPEGQYVEFVLSGMDIEYEDDCLYDYMEFHDGDNPNAVAIGSRFCGGIDDLEDSQLTRRSTGSSMFLVFNSDANENGEGFEGQFSMVSTPGVPLCPDSPVDVSGSGTITFPPNGGRYVNQMSCEWRFSAETGKKIKLSFQYLDVEFDPACEFDALSIYDSESPSAVPRHSLCGELDTGYEIVSSSNYLFMRFSSDASVTGSGFELEYDIEDAEDDGDGDGDGDDDLPIFGCSSEAQIIPPEGGIIKVPTDESSYDNNQDCVWRLFAPDGQVVRAKFLSMDIVSSQKCSGDRLEIADGENLEEEKLLGRLCGSGLPTDEYTTTGNIMSIRFFSNANGVASGFKLVLRPGLKGNCGSPQVSRGTGRIVGGVIAKPHSWPWQVSLRDRSSGNYHFCGGSIISSNWIVTAAHCVKEGEENSLHVLAGAHQKAWRESSEINRQVRRVSKIIRHPRYTDIGSAPDVALLQLSSPLDLGPETTKGTAHPVCLPKGDVAVPDYTACFTTGWGTTNDPALQAFLNQVEVPIVPQDVCRLPGYYGNEVKDFEVCAGYRQGGKDSCQGDSGGPLVCFINGKYELHGITSWGIGCGVTMKPGIYTRVTEIEDWIRRKINS